MRQVEFYIKFVDNLNDCVGKIFSFLVYLMMFTLLYEVIMRYAFNKPTIWAHETSEFFYAAHFLVGGAFALRWGAHINIEVLYRRWSLRTRAIVDLITWTLFYIFCGVLLWQGIGIAWDSVIVLEYSDSAWGPPIWPVKLAIPLAAALVLLQGLTKTIKDAYTAITGRELIADIGTKVADSEVKF